MTFKAGKSGNPSGRPKGIQDRRTLFRAMIEPKSEELLDTAIALALNGNEPMLKLLLDRLLPVKPKGDPVNIELPKTGLSSQLETIIGSLNEGNLTVTDASKLMNMIVAQSKIIEFDCLVQKVEELERIVAEQSNTPTGCISPTAESIPCSTLGPEG